MGFSLSSLGIGGHIVDTAFGAINQGISSHYQKALTKYVNTHKHQWEVEDLRKAGLNPILSAMNGMGYASANAGSLSSSDGGELSAHSAQKMNRDSLKTQKEIADMQNATQREFNQEANRIALKNALSNELTANSNAAYQKAATDAALAGIVRADKVAMADIEMKRAIGAGALMQGNAALSNADTNLKHYESQKENYSWDSKIKSKQFGLLESDPHTGKYGKTLGFVDYVSDKLAQFLPFAKSSGNSGYTFNK